MKTRLQVSATNPIPVQDVNGPGKQVHAAVTAEVNGRSPEDHAVLEAEYQRNPKPDKAARSEIVGRVSLGEKEVQVSGLSNQ